MKRIATNIFIIFSVGALFGGAGITYAEDATSTPDIIPSPVDATSSTSTIDVPPVPDATSTPPLDVTVLIRSGEMVLYNGTSSLAATGTIDIVDATSVSHPVDAQSVLAVLYGLDQTSDAFSISNLQYYDSFGAFYLKCITPQDSAGLCDNWQYVVDAVAPLTSMDDAILSGGESIGLYFGNPHQLVLGANATTTGGSILVSAQKYNYLDNTWGSLLGVTIDITVPNPDDPWNPTVLSEIEVNDVGEALLTFAELGTYTIGIKEDYLFPSYTVIVSAPPPPPPHGGGGEVEHNTLDVSKAVEFLMSQQSQNGSFGEDLYTDWAAIGLAKAPDANVSALKTYISTHKLRGNLLTDYERRAMALEALGINPYTGTDTNYIEEILDEFDGEQFGDDSLYNDDIFAIIPLLNAGYGEDDEEIQKTVIFILSKQNENGSWDGVDITAAAISALSSLTDLDGVSEAIEKARAYLRDAQGGDGGFGSSFSTSWVLQAIAALGESGSSWVKSNKNPQDYLFEFQASDGGVEQETVNTSTRIWATSYAIPAALELSWDDILRNFPRQEQERRSRSSSRIRNEDEEEVHNEVREGVDEGSDEEIPVATSSVPEVESAPLPSVVYEVLPQEVVTLASVQPTPASAPHSRASELALLLGAGNVRVNLISLFAGIAGIALAAFFVFRKP